MVKAPTAADGSLFTLMMVDFDGNANGSYPSKPRSEVWFFPNGAVVVCARCRVVRRGCGEVWRGMMRCSVDRVVRRVVVLEWRGEERCDVV